MSAARALTESEEAIAQRVAELVLVELRAPRGRPTRAEQPHRAPSAESMERMARKMRQKGIR